MADNTPYSITNNRLMQQLKRAPELLIPYLFSAMKDIVFLLQSKLGYADGYAPSSEANLPGRVDENGEALGYYERGRGWWYPVHRRTSLGGLDSVAEGAQTLESASRRHKIDVRYDEDIELRAGKIVKSRGALYQEVTYHTRRTPIVAGYKLAKGRNGNPGTSELLGKNWTTNVETSKDAIAGEVGTPVTYADYVQGFNVSGVNLSRGWEPMDERVEALLPQFDDRLNVALDEFISDLGEQK